MAWSQQGVHLSIVDNVFIIVALMNYKCVNVHVSQYLDRPLAQSKFVFDERFEQ